MADNPNFSLRIFNPALLMHEGTSLFALDLVAARDWIALAPQDDAFARSCAEACGISPVEVESWRLREFASPYYGEEPFSETWGTRVDRLWRLVVDLGPGVQQDPMIPAGRPASSVALPDSVEVGGDITPLEDLPVLAIGDARERTSCLAAVHDLPEDSGVEVITYDGYSQLRVDVSQWHLNTLEALDEFIEVCDRHEIHMSWRDRLLYF